MALRILIANRPRNPSGWVGHSLTQQHPPGFATPLRKNPPAFGTSLRKGGKAEAGGVSFCGTGEMDGDVVLGLAPLSSLLYLSCSFQSSLDNGLVNPVAALAHDLQRFSYTFQHALLFSLDQYSCRADHL